MVRMDARLVQATGMLPSLGGTPRERAATTTYDVAKLNAQLQAETRAREATEARLRQMEKMETIGQLTSGIAHDFANLVMIIMGNLEVVRQRLAQGRTDIADLVDKAIDGGHRASALTCRLLAFSKRRPLALEVVDINALVTSMAELLRDVLGEGVELECACADGLWRTCVDPGQLENAILNLALNARDAMPDGGHLRIETRNADSHDGPGAVPVSQCVVITVTDTGAGMPPEVAACAFDPFFTTKAEGKGTGLGLSQVYGFIRQSQGHIEIRSEPGRGTALKMYLPRYTGGAGVPEAIGDAAGAVQ